MKKCIKVPFRFKLLLFIHTRFYTFYTYQIIQKIKWKGSKKHLMLQSDMIYFEKNKKILLNDIHNYYHHRLYK